MVVPFAGAQEQLTAALARLGTIELLDGDTFTVADNRQGDVTAVNAPAGISIVGAHDRPGSYHARNVGAAGVETIGEMIDEFHPGAIIYFGWSNKLVSPEQVAQLSNDIQQRSTAGGGVPTTSLLGMPPCAFKNAATSARS